MLLLLPAASDAVAVFTSPAAPVAGGPLRAMAVADRPLDVAFTVLGPRGQLLERTRERRGGPPYSWSIELTTRRPGTYRVCLGGLMACEDVLVVDGPPRRPSAAETWPVTRVWDRAVEDLYAAWIEKLFDDPLTAEPSWHSLHEVTRQPERNVLYDHRGLGEDGERGLRLEPDCADLPYVLRAYFAWKLGLPFGYSECSRGANGQPPACPHWMSAPAAPAAGDALAGAFAARGRCHRGPVVVADAPYRVSPPASGSGGPARAQPQPPTRRRLRTCGQRVSRGLTCSAACSRWTFWVPRLRRAAAPVGHDRGPGDRREDPDAPRVARRAAAALGTARARVAPGRARGSRSRARPRRSLSRLTSPPPAPLARRSCRTGGAPLRPCRSLTAR